MDFALLSTLALALRLYKSPTLRMYPIGTEMHKVLILVLLRSSIDSISSALLQANLDYAAKGQYTNWVRPLYHTLVLLRPSLHNLFPELVSPIFLLGLLQKF